MPETRQLVLDHPAQCSLCGAALDSGDLVFVDSNDGRVTCVPCKGVPAGRTRATPDPAVGFGTPGGSAQREYERRRRKERQLAERQRGMRLGFVAIATVGGYVGVQLFAASLNHNQVATGTLAHHSVLAPSSAHGLGFMFALIAGVSTARALWGRRQSTEAWGHGARGERIVAARLATLRARGVECVHDRRVPGSRANIDHIAVGPTGVYVIDAKVTKGAVSAKTTGPIWNRGPVRLFFGGRDQSSAITGMERQIQTVATALEHGHFGAVAIRPMLVLVGAEWGWFARPLRVRGVWVGWPRAMAKSVGAAGPMSPELIHRITTHLATALAEA